ncbi:beta-ketoacyl-[acyl-carrier-protein] synthase family protein [Nocardioides sp.]|uniref:beta-ketoacyl-[acyl-carrier-protein] synthase family protein n=1 Tax=Nocardioides sp. TaxID=35761 RepID=UPI0026358A07|nr:beta-ketoacyl-[acyl-carrier-protein] synthase family protein [Nocardioides sp.]MDI6912330.1 beta-ketoacyl-[acyl-carrier-protein] synthase family protein [Nocardioides sp.]
MKDVVISGTGIVSSLGLERGEYRDNMLVGKLAIDPAPWADPESPTAWISRVHGFNAGDWMEPHVEDGTDLYSQFLIAAAVQAVADAGIEEPDPMRTAVVMGTSMAGVKTLTGAQAKFEQEGPSAVPRKVHIQAWANMAAGQVAMRWQLHGPLLSVCTACASSLDAIGIAARMIESGMADVAIAGGADTGLLPILYHSQVAYGMASATAIPEQVSRPFDVDRVGLLEGEGAGVVVLESRKSARSRGMTPRASVRGYASLADSYHPSSPEPTGKWEALAMRRAIEEADLPEGASSVDALVAHATGTQAGDSAEISAINDVFASDGSAPPLVTSIKGHIGHTAGAAGVMALIAALESAEVGKFMPTVGCKSVDPAARFPIVTGAAADVEIGTLQVNSFGFGGQDASMVLTRPVGEGAE